MNWSANDEASASNQVTALDSWETTKRNENRILNILNILESIMDRLDKIESKVGK